MNFPVNVLTSVVAIMFYLRQYLLTDIPFSKKGLMVSEPPHQLR